MRENQMDMSNAAGVPFGQLIREYRKRAGLNQEQLGKLAGVKKNAVGAWEAGRSRPDVASIPILCRALDMTLEDFFGTMSNGVLRETSEVAYDAQREAEAEDRRMVNRFHQLNEYNQKIVLRQIDTLIDLQKDD